MSNGQIVTYRLNSAPVHNSGHTRGKKIILANNVKWTESNLQSEFSTSAQQSTGKKIVMDNNVKWTDSNLQAKFGTSAQQWTHKR